ncbi:MAG TPA: hypothetical protein VMV03_01675 [Spirochaetia bacterium]|nr:hypothetical protein [Spirochaetia bacterium]
MGRKWRMVRTSVLVMALAVAARGLWAQESTPRTILVFGPRLGVSAVLQEPGAFSSDMQKVTQDADRSFFPVFSEVGIGAGQFIPLGSSGTYITFQQAFLVGGLDQRMPLPSAFLTLGCRLPFGLEAGVGPYGTLTPLSGSAEFVLSMVYTAGWVFATPDFQVPITLMFVPIPGYLNPRITLLFGINFWMLR